MHSRVGVSELQNALFSLIRKIDGMKLPSPWPHNASRLVRIGQTRPGSIAVFLATKITTVSNWTHLLRCIRANYSRHSDYSRRLLTEAVTCETELVVFQEDSEIRTITESKDKSRGRKASRKPWFCDGSPINMHLDGLGRGALTYSPWRRLFRHHTTWVLPGATP